MPYADPAKRAACKARYAAQHAEAIATAKRAAYLADRERLKAKARAAYCANREAKKAAVQDYKTRNSDRVREMDAAGKRRRRAAKPHVHAECEARRRVALRRPVEWADKGLILDIYAYAAAVRAAGVDCHVDHVVPLRSKMVCGLHTHENLTVMLARDNKSKGNRFGAP